MQLEPVRVKICGITSAADAAAAVEAGANGLGFMLFQGSKRWVTVEAAGAICRSVPRSVHRVGVFVNPEASDVRRAISELALDTVQFHGEEAEPFCLQFGGVQVWKAIRVQDQGSLVALGAFGGVDAWLLDSHVPGQRGGSGERFNWDLAVEANGRGRPIVLAGGLNPGNVAEAVRRVRPAWVDVSSGVESAPGCKDPARMRAFVAAVKAANRGD